MAASATNPMTTLASSIAALALKEINATGGDQIKNMDSLAAADQYEIKTEERTVLRQGLDG